MNRKILILLLLVGVQFACTSETPTANNANSTVNTNKAETNINATNVNSANANATDANVAVKPAEPKVYTDANEALADAKKLIDLSKNEEAIEILKQAVKLNPDLADAHFQMGIAYGLIEMEKKEEVSLEGSTNTNTNTKTTVKKVAKDAPITDSEKSYNEAIKAYSKYLVKNPKDDSAQFNLARCYNKLNKDKEAEKAIRKAITMNPSNSEYQAELGAILIKFAKYQEAIGVLKKALKLDENNSRIESLLEKAEAGRKREDYGKPKEAPAEKK
ncbi:MAG: tetratricopeptide repeat protein [Pyrinomonadaceae bacterium]|jgi:tetratricopeptide (TPR) repeat protein|nr:tetratricopeptide repeat protein [Pyrinomonadaceae bacterium]